MLGFRQSNNSSNDLLTNLGAVSTFDSLLSLHPGAVISVNTGSFLSGGSGASGINGIGGLGADLASIWGPNWFSLTDSTTWNSGNKSILFGAIGSSGSTIYVTNSSVTPYTPSASGSQNGAATAVNNLGNASYDGNTSTDNSNFNILSGGAYAANTFRSGSSGPNADFTLYPSSPAPSTNPSFEVPQGLRLNLDREIAGGTSGTLLGFFSLDTSGNLTYTVATAVPEPGTSALVVGGAIVLLVVAAKRRFASEKA